MTNLCRIYVELCRMNVGFMSNEVHITKAQPTDIHIVNEQLMSNVEQNREKENTNNKSRTLKCSDIMPLRFPFS